MTESLSTLEPPAPHAGGTAEDGNDAPGFASDANRRPPVAGPPSFPWQREALAEVCARHGVSLCYLFGSRAEGFAAADSDWDVGVVFERDRFPVDRTEAWLSLVDDLERIFPAGRLDLIFLQDAPPRLQNEATRGKLIFARSDIARADFEEEVMRRWMDLRPFIEAQERDEEEAIRSGHFFVKSWRRIR